MLASAHAQARPQTHAARVCARAQVVRGGPAFAVSLDISGIEPTLRNAADLGAWQVWLGPAALH